MAQEEGSRHVGAWEWAIDGGLRSRGEQGLSEMIAGFPVGHGQLRFGTWCYR